MPVMGLLANRIAARAVDAEERPSGLYPGLEGSLLLVIQRIARSVVPDNELELGELLRIHDSAVLGDEIRPAMLMRNGCQGCIGGLNRRLVTVSKRLGEDQYS